MRMSFAILYAGKTFLILCRYYFAIPHVRPIFNGTVFVICPARFGLFFHVNIYRKKYDCNFIFFNNFVLSLVLSCYAMQICQSAIICTENFCFELFRTIPLFVQSNENFSKCSELVFILRLFHQIVLFGVTFFYPLLLAEKSEFC